MRIVIQMSLLSYWYPDTFEFNRFFPNLDHVFATAEEFIFNGQPAIWFCHTFPHLIVSEAFNMGYFFYYPMMLIVALFYFIYKFEWFEKMSFVLVTSFFIYYLIYIFVPVAGPQFYFPAIGIDNVSKGIFPAIGDYFNHNQELLPYIHQCLLCYLTDSLFKRKLFDTNRYFLLLCINKSSDKYAH